MFKDYEQNMDEFCHTLSQEKLTKTLEQRDTLLELGMNPDQVNLANIHASKVFR